MARLVSMAVYQLYGIVVEPPLTRLFQILAGLFDFLLWLQHPTILHAAIYSDSGRRYASPGCRYLGRHQCGCRYRQNNYGLLGRFQSVSFRQNKPGQSLTENFSVCQRHHERFLHRLSCICHTTSNHVAAGRWKLTGLIYICTAIRCDRRGGYR